MCCVATAVASREYTTQASPHLHDEWDASAGQGLSRSRSRELLLPRFALHAFGGEIIGAKTKTLAERATCRVPCRMVSELPVFHCVQCLQVAVVQEEHAQQVRSSIRGFGRFLRSIRHHNPIVNIHFTLSQDVGTVKNVACNVNITSKPFGTPTPKARRVSLVKGPKSKAIRPSKIRQMRKATAKAENPEEPMQTGDQTAAAVTSRRAAAEHRYKKKEKKGET